MANTINSANMLLPIPVVGTDPGPQYATDINSCLTLIDGHNHTPGYGVAIPTDGLNINSDLTFNNFNAVSIKSVRFQSQGSPLAGATDLGCVYESGVDLWYNDGNGNQIQITSGGALAGTPGSISGLVSPASASYVALSETFVWQSDALTPANMDFASAILRNLSASSKGLTLQPPAAMAADYSITLPTLPASQKIVTMDASGVMAAAWVPDGTSITVTANQLVVVPDGVSIQNTGAGVAAKNTTFTMDFELNGNYGSLSLPSNQIDGLRFFNFNAAIINAWAWIKSPGASGTTIVDIKYASAPGGSFASIFSTTPKFASTASASSYTDSTGVVSPGTGVTAGVLSTTSVAAGGALRMDITGAMVNPDSIGVTILYKQR